MTKPGPGSKFDVEFKGRKYDSGSRWWGTTKEGIEKIISAGRIWATENSIRFVKYFDDFPYKTLSNLWEGFGGAANPIYVVQTNTEIIRRCMLLTTDPGDLVFDPTCGSGSTAYTAELFGRRWMACDTSRVAIALAKQRMMTAAFPYFALKKPEEGLQSGFIYKTYPRITMASVANNAPPHEETLYDQPKVEKEKVRAAGPFTVEAVPSLRTKPFDSKERNSSITGIAVDDPIRLSFSCDPNHQYPDYAVSYRDACGRVSYVGCLRSNCANTGAEISGYWQMPGEVCRAPSVFDLVTQNPNSERVLYFRDIGSRKQTFGDLKDMTDQD
jgi:hypothetical protein